MVLDGSLAPLTVKIPPDCMSPPKEIFVLLLDILIPQLSPVLPFINPLNVSLAKVPPCSVT
jgi:hypothetical protein